MNNRIKTAILLAALTAFIIWIGGMLGGRSGMIIALFMAGVMNFVSYWFSDKIVLKMYRATEVDQTNAPDLMRMVRDLSASAALPVPRVYIIPGDAPNAFATGRNPENAAVAVTEGIVRLLEPEELAGVIGHELGHIKNRDILIGTVAATMAGAIMMLASMAKWGAFLGAGRDDEEGGGLGFIGIILMSILAPIGATLIQMAISRSREYLADDAGAEISGSRFGLARALEKLTTYNQKIHMDAQPATAHMFIVNPLSGSAVFNLFSTHPPIEERIARLRGGARPEAKTETRFEENQKGDGNRNGNSENMWDKFR